MIDSWDLLLSILFILNCLCLIGQQNIFLIFLNGGVALFTFSLMVLSMKGRSVMGVE